MLDNFSFTLYEIFGYVMPGGVALAAFTIFYWAFFVPTIPLGVATFAPGVGTWVLMLGASYILGHASQAVGNRLLGRIDKAALELNHSPILRKSAFACAARIFGVEEKALDARWVYRVLDERAVQTGEAGDRDIFIYREGFYRGTCISLFLLSVSLFFRMGRAGTAIKFAHWTMQVKWEASLLTAIVVALLGCLFFNRYQRFANYRVTRAVISALVLEKFGKQSDEATSEKGAKG